MIRRARLWLRLLGLLREAVYCAAVGGTDADYAHDRLRARILRSEVEAIHRDLGHDYDHDAILADHQ